MPHFQFTFAKLKTAFSRPLNPQDRRFTPFSAIALYSPVSYLPSALAIRLGRWADLSPMSLFYCGRIATLLAYATLAFFAVRLTLIHKWTLALVVRNAAGPILCRIA